MTIIEEPLHFRNGWPCRECGRITEHKHLKGVEVCVVCGHPLNQRPDVKEKKLQTLKMEAEAGS